jgi:hypothetical protein
MVEAKTTGLEKVTELVLGKNIDRIERIDCNRYLVASYQLDKETMEKSGQLVVVRIGKGGVIEILSESEPYDFGVLSLSVYAEKEETCVAIGCSDGCLRVGRLVDDLVTFSLVTGKPEDDSCLFSDLKDSMACLGMQKGMLQVTDLATNELV